MVGGRQGCRRGPESAPYTSPGLHSGCGDCDRCLPAGEFRLPLRCTCRTHCLEHCFRSAVRRSSLRQRRRKSPLSLRPALGAWRADGAHDGGTAGLLCDGKRWRIFSGLRATPLSLRHPGQCSSTADRAGPARSLLWSLRSNPLLHHILSNLLSCPLCRFTLPAQRAGDALVVPCRSHTVSSGCTLINLLILMHDPVPALLGLLAVLCGDPVRR